MSNTESTPRTYSSQSIKVTDAHRARLAVVYVRQSTPQQVAELERYLTTDDVITAADKKPIKSEDDLSRAIQAGKAGDKMVRAAQCSVW